MPGCALDGLADFFRGAGGAEAIGDVAGVAEGAGKMAFEDVGLEVGVVAAADGGDKIGEVVGVMVRAGREAS